MELRQLRYFVRIVELGSMGRAAADLDMVQSALSQQISRLESELSTRLLQRTSKGAVPTEAGLAFFREAQLALRHADQAARAAQQARLTGSVSVGLSPTTASVLGVPLMRAMHERYPDVRLHMVGSLSGHLSNLLNACQIFLGLAQLGLRVLKILVASVRDLRLNVSQLPLQAQHIGHAHIPCFEQGSGHVQFSLREPRHRPGQTQPRAPGAAARTGRLQKQGGEHPLGLDPAAQVAQGVGQQTAQHKQVCHLRQARRAHAEIGLHGGGQHGGVLVQQFLQAQQPLAAHQQGHIHLGAAGLVLELELGVYFGRGHATIIGDRTSGGERKRVIRGQR
eukprot:gene40198-49710_t